MTSIVKYAEGFIEGAERGRPQFASMLGKETLEGLKEFIDASARVSPNTLHHVYEWYQAGSPAARLFHIDYTVSGYGLSFNSTFRQSSSIKQGSKVPFYNKAEIMENGIPVVISPKSSKVLAFEENGETVFTKSPVTVQDPGGQFVQGSYERIFDQFFQQYFTQSFLQASGIMKHLEYPVAFKRNIASGKRGGRAAGIAVGMRWITGRSS